VGHYKTYGNLTQVVVYDAGHLVPMDQPESASDMLKKFLSKEFV